MELTDKEKELFSRHYESLEKTPLEYVDYVLPNIYYYSDSYDDIYTVLGYLKRMILEVAKKKNFNIDENKKFDIDSLLSEIIGEDEDLVGFKPSYCKYSEALNTYFDETIKNMDWEEADRIKTSFAYKKDNFRLFFIDYVQLMLKIPNDLAREIENIESETVDNQVEYHNESENNISNEEDFGDFDWGEYDFSDMGDIDDRPTETKEDLLTEDNFNKLVEFINSVPELLKCRDNCSKTIEKMVETIKNKKLNEFYSNEEFVKRLNAIMKHDERKDVFYYHGTQCLADADSIIEQGLGMTSKDISSTAYSEFTQDELILYSRGFAGEIGRHAIVIIDVPIDIDGHQMEVVHELKDKDSISFLPSGLQGLNGGANYVIDSQYIVGYVDKDNKKVIFNPKYKDYDRFSEYTSEEEKSK